MPVADARGALVSIIVPARNAGPWIEESIRSALAQTHPNVEVLLVDNGSTDDTVERALALGDPRLRVIREMVPGPSAARNAGLDASRGEYIQFLDADDAMVPTKVARQLATLTELGGDVVWGAFVRARDDGRPMIAHSDPLVQPRMDEDVEVSLLEADGFVHLGATLIRRSAIGDIRFDTAVRVAEDVRFLFTLAAARARFVRSADRSGYVMREHDNAERASRVGKATFWTSCGDLAAHAEARWRAEGTLDPRRAASLARVLVGVARNLAGENLEAALAALARARGLTPRYYEAFPASWQLCVRTIGFERTERLAAAVRFARRRWSA